MRADIRDRIICLGAMPANRARHLPADSKLQFCLGVIGELEFQVIFPAHSFWKRAGPVKLGVPVSPRCRHAFDPIKHLVPELRPALAPNPDPAQRFLTVRRTTTLVQEIAMK